MKRMLLTLVVSSLLMAGCTKSIASQITTTPSASSSTPPASTSGKIAGFVASDVALHHSESDCWISIDGSVYNVTSYLPMHPGGAEVIVNQCGGDASSAFHTMNGRGRDHPRGATALLKGMYKGVLQ